MEEEYDVTLVVINPPESSEKGHPGQENYAFILEYKDEEAKKIVQCLRAQYAGYPVKHPLSTVTLGQSSSRGSEELGPRQAQEQQVLPSSLSQEHSYSRRRPSIYNNKRVLVNTDVGWKTKLPGGRRTTTKKKCLICGLKFSRAITLTRHLKEHRGHLPYSCLVCEFVGVCKSDLLLHTRGHVKKRGRDQCSHCPYWSKDQEDAAEHEEQCHQNWDRIYIKDEPEPASNTLMGESSLIDQVHQGRKQINMGSSNPADSDPLIVVYVGEDGKIAGIEYPDGTQEGNFQVTEPSSDNNSLNCQEGLAAKLYCMEGDSVLKNYPSLFSKQLDGRLKEENVDAEVVHNNKDESWIVSDPQVALARLNKPQHQSTATTSSSSSACQMTPDRRLSPKSCKITPRSRKQSFNNIRREGKRSAKKLPTTTSKNSGPRPTDFLLEADHHNAATASSRRLSKFRSLKRRAKRGIKANASIPKDIGVMAKKLGSRRRSKFLTRRRQSPDQEQGLPNPSVSPLNELFEWKRVASKAEMNRLVNFLK